MSRWVSMLVFAAVVTASVSMLVSGDASSRSGAAEPASGPAIVKGDIDCDFDVDPVDALQVLRSVAALAPDQAPNCPDIDEKVPMGEAPFSFGDMDCDLDVDAVDALQILLFVAALETDLPPGCTEIGTPILFVVLPDGTVECWPALISYELLTEGSLTGLVTCTGPSAPATTGSTDWVCEFPETIPLTLTPYEVGCDFLGATIGGESISYTCEADQLHQYADCEGSVGVETGKQPDYECDLEADEFFEQVICLPVVDGSGPDYYCYLTESGVDCELTNPGGIVFFPCIRDASVFDCTAP